MAAATTMAAISRRPPGIDITEVISTLMACDGLEQEQAFLAALEAADSFTVVAGNLQLLENGTVLAELAPANQ